MQHSAHGPILFGSFLLLIGRLRAAVLAAAAENRRGRRRRTDHRPSPPQPSAYSSRRESRQAIEHSQMIRCERMVRFMVILLSTSDRHASPYVSLALAGICKIKPRATAVIRSKPDRTIECPMTMAAYSIGSFFFSLVSALLVAAFSALRPHAVEACLASLPPNRCAGRYLIAVAYGMAQLGVSSPWSGTGSRTTTSAYTSIWWGLMEGPAMIVIALTGWVVYRYQADACDDDGPVLRDALQPAVFESSRDWSPSSRASSTTGSFPRSPPAFSWRCAGPSLGKVPRRWNGQVARRLPCY